MYRRPKFLEVLLEIRQEMARDADYDVNLFAEMVRSGKIAENENGYDLTEPELNEEKTNLKSKRTSEKK